jgi:DNA-binding SARP family transcriptional activator
MIKRLWSGFWFAVLLAGIPVVLVSTAGNPLPARRDVAALVAEPLTEQSIYAAIAVVAWLIWAGLLYAAVAEVWTWAWRGVRWLPRLPLPTPMQGLAGGMLGAVAVTAQPGAEAAAPAVATSTVDDPSPAVLHDRQQYEAATGVQLPDGGWLPAPVAYAVDAAGALVWWRRRRQYQIGSSGADGAHVDLVPLPAAARAVQAALDDAALVPGPPAALLLGLPAGGVALTGPGAAAAARGLLATLLLTHTADHPRVVVTRRDLQTLLGADSGLHDVPGLHLAESLPDALNALDRIVVDHPGRPTTILTAAPDDENLGRRLAALLTLGTDRGLTGVIVGPWPHGTTWHVEADGTVDATPERLCTLPGPAAADLLTLATLRTRETPPDTQQTPPEPPSAPSPPLAPPEPGRGTPVRLTLLGGVRVTAGAEQLSIRRTAAVQILVFLALHPHGATSGQLCEAIWPQLRRHAATGRFYTTISELRGILRTATGGHEVINHTGDRYLLDPALVETDVARLQAAQRTAVTAPTAGEREQALRQMVDQYSGELAAGHRWPWLTTLREAIHRHIIDAYLRLAGEQPHQAAQLLHQATRVDPINEQLHAQALAALAAAGQHHTAATLRADHARHLATTPQPPDQGV